MLYDVSGGRQDRLVRPAETATNMYVQAHARHNQGAEGKHVVTLLNQGIDALLNGHRIRWTRAGVMWGHSSDRPPEDVQDLWESILKIVGGGKDAPIMLGCLFRHLIAQRPEAHWLCLTTVTDKIDPLTLKNIRTTEYWLAPGFIPRAAPKSRGNTLQDLAAKWGSSALSGADNGAR